MPETGRADSEGTVLPQRLKRTHLYPVHRKMGAKLVEFAGWEMPLQYTGILKEHHAVRNEAGLFDVSHMGKIELRGPRAQELCQEATANDVTKLKASQAQYSLLLREDGGILDDIVVYPLSPEHYFLCVNAVNTEKNFLWLSEKGGQGVEVQEATSRYVQLALQGPSAERILGRLTSIPLAELKPFYFLFGEVSSVRCLVSRTGYTGEDGFEIYGEAEQAARLWEEMMRTGIDLGLQPAGLGARDTLRLERALPLYGHELSETVTPLEAGLGWVVKFSKPSFIGREALLRQKTAGIKKKLVGLELVEPGIPRSQCPIVKEGRKLGEVTSGTMSPTLGKSIALGFVDTAQGDIDNTVEIEIRGRKVGARVIPLPFYRRQGLQGKK